MINSIKTNYKISKRAVEKESDYVSDEKLIINNSVGVNVDFQQRRVEDFII